jgi:hypothetical protein
MRIEIHKASYGDLDFTLIPENEDEKELLTGIYKRRQVIVASRKSKGSGNVRFYNVSRFSISRMSDDYLDRDQRYGHKSPID